jgi:hypothetical protein
MTEKIALKSSVKTGVVPTHIKFAGGIVQDDQGRYVRSASGALAVVEEMTRLCEESPVKLTAVQLPFFAGANESDVKELFSGLKGLGLEIHLIFMVGGATPMNPADEDAVIAQLVPGLKTAIANGVKHVASTSIEEWMGSDKIRREGADFEAGIAQNVKLHLRAYQEAGLEGSCIENWHIEFLRPGEFKTFTDLGRAWNFVSEANKALGKKFFKILLDAAHCGDSGLTIPENEKLIAEIAAAGELGVFHASAKTTRGCLSTDDGWIGALMAAAAKTGELKYVFVEVFHHEDDGLELLRNLDPGHGIDTRDGRSYRETVIDGVSDVAHRLNNLVARGVLKD